MSLGTSMVTATTWVPRGFAASFPTKQNIDENELLRISKLTKLNLNDAKNELKVAEDGKETSSSDDELEAGGVVTGSSKSKESLDDDLKEYDLEHYDTDEEAEEDRTMFGNLKSLVVYEDNADDPYITLQDNQSDDEREDLQILATDNLVVAAKVEDEVASLEIYVYEDEADNLYVHHDIMLPAIPLCVEWLDLPVGKTADGHPVDKDAKGNIVAVGTMDPDIEIWDLDTIDCMFPNAILGQGGAEDSTEMDSSKKKKKRKKSRKVNDDYHVDAVLALAANRNHRNLLASASADKSVKLWDLNTTSCAKSYLYHTDKVCSLAWHPKETTVLLSGSYDRTVVAADMRAPDAKMPRWGVESDIEMVRWNPHDANYFFATTENGLVHYHDIRTVPSKPEASKPVWKLQAHDKSVSSFDVNPTIPGFLVTGSADELVKLWTFESKGPSLVASRNLGVGKVFSTTFAPDVEVCFRLAVAGEEGSVQIWDTSTNPAARRTFATRMAPIEGEVKERLITVGEDSSDDEEEGGVEPGGENEKDWDSMDED